MTLTLTLDRPSSLPRPLDRGLSDDALALRRLMMWQADFSPSISTTSRLEAVQAALMSAFGYSQTTDWDGYDALPADIGSLIYALHFMQQLPPSLPIPEVGIDPDGLIALDWDYEPRRILSVRVANDGTIHYAGLDGSAIFHGTEILREGIPEVVSTAISRVTSDLGTQSAA